MSRPLASHAAKQKEHPLGDALVVATNVESELLLACDRILLAGSARRQRPFVHDLDFVVIPQGKLIKDKNGKAVPLSGQNRWFDIPRIVKEFLNGSIINQGPNIFTAEVEGIQIDINRATEETWAILSTVKTGPVDFNIQLCNRAQKLGMKLSPYVGILKGGALLPLASEEDVFKTLDLPFIEPHRRDAAVEDLRAGLFPMFRGG